MKRKLTIVVTVAGETDCQPVGAGSYEHEVRNTHDVVERLIEAELRFWQTGFESRSVAIHSKWEDV